MWRDVSRAAPIDRTGDAPDVTTTAGVGRKLAVLIKCGLHLHQELEEIVRTTYNDRDSHIAHPAAPDTTRQLPFTSMSAR